MNTIWNPEIDPAIKPKYKGVEHAIRRAIDAGELKVGDKLPPVRELGWQVKMTPGTVARAYTILTQEGLLVAEVGRGTYVAAPLTLLQDDVWSQQTEPPETDAVSLFSPRMPDVGQVGLIQGAMQQVSKGPASMFLIYPTRSAHLPVRQAVVDWLSEVQLGPLSPEDVVLTHGGQNGIVLVLQTILQGPRPAILVEDLSYAGFRRAADILRADLHGVAMDHKGVIPEALDAMIRRTGAQVFCSSPEVQNPTAIFTPLKRRRALADVCIRHGVQILDDDCYGMGVPKAASYRALAPECSWYISSISKTLTPALRFGYAIAPRGRAQDLRRVAEYAHFGLAQPLTEVVRLVLEDPRSREMATAVRKTLNAHVEVAVNTLGAFDLSWARNVPFVWLQLPPGWRAAAFCRAAEAEGVQIRSADEFALRDGRAPHAVRIAMNGQVALSSFEAAMERLRILLNNPPEQISV